MKKFITIFLVFVMTICTLFTPASAKELEVIKALGAYPRPPAAPPSVAKSLGVEFTSHSESLMKNQPVMVEIKITNVPEGTVASLQWKQDNTPLSDGYFSNINLYEGITISYQGLLPYYSQTGYTSVSVDIAVDGIIREELIAIPYSADVYIDTEVQRVLELVQPMRISATITSGCSTYANSSLTSKIGTVSAGTSVTYFDHNEEYSAYVQLPDATYVWIPYGSVCVSTSNFTESGDYTDSEKEIFVNAKGYDSSTGYLIWINPKRQKVNIFVGSRFKWKLLKAFPCATGANITPTPMGVYKYVARDTAWIKPDYQVRPILYFDIYRGLAFHSRLYSPDGSRLIDATIGRPASHGCIRMYDEDVRWMESDLPFKTTVVVY